VAGVDDEKAAGRAVFDRITADNQNPLEALRND